MVLNACVQKPLIKAHADLSREAKVLKFGLSLHLYSYFVYASSKGSGESAKTRPSLRCSLIQLTLKAPITTAADDKFCNTFPNFRQNKV